MFYKAVVKMGYKEAVRILTDTATMLAIIHREDPDYRLPRQNTLVQVHDTASKAHGSLRLKNRAFSYKKTAFEFNMVGSDAVVRAFNNLMQFFYRADEQGPENIDPKEMIKHWGQFLIEVRKSLGNPKTKLTAVDMFRSLIKDVEKNTA